jgi:hypothetical protein
VASRLQVDAEQDRLAGEQYRKLIKRIVASSEFQRATKQREFLLYVTDHKLSGSPENVTEALIGHRVYGRPATYDTGNDSIVRTEARTLRKRLERYFDAEGLDEPVIVEIPRGGYLPVFRPRIESAPAAFAPVPAQDGLLSRITRRQWIWYGASAATGAGAMFALRNRTFSRSQEEAPSRTPGLVQLESSDAQLNLAFQQAKQRALSCVYTGDPVGEWYATRPDGGSNVFCMRDVSHQSTGAAVLGLTRHTANMLHRFAQSVARSRDWCGYWIITKDGFAAPNVYKSDNDFGYCLPANFDVLRSCHRQFLWTGDAAFQSADFLNFYERTVQDYPVTWDQDRDGIMENLRRPRVHASYYQREPRFLTGADLVAAQYTGYLTFAAMQESMGREGSLSKRMAREYRDKADRLRQRFNAEWWNPAQNRFYSGILPDRTFGAELVPECNLYTLLFGIPEDGPKAEAALNTAESERPQFPGAYSYIPEVLYRYDRNESAYSFLLETAGPDFFGKDVGEVAFAVIGAVATGLMGLTPDASKSTIETLPRLSQSLKWAKLVHVPVMRNEITVEHRGTHESTLTNSAGPALQWKVSFPVPESGQHAHIVVDGVATPATLERRVNRQPVISTVVRVGPGQSRAARYLA